jgi:hypothetical protein
MYCPEEPDLSVNVSQIHISVLEASCALGSVIAACFSPSLCLSLQDLFSPTDGAITRNDFSSEAPHFYPQSSFGRITGAP